MKRYCLLTLTVVVCGVGVSIAQAACVATGEISRVSVNPGTVASSFYVRTSTPGSASMLFASNDEKVMTAALSAQASHERVQVTGNATACGAVASGVSLGGAVVAIITAP